MSGTTITWTNPTKNTDGGDYDAATENAGYELAFDAQTAAVSLPLAFGTSFDFGTTQAYQDLKSGSHSVKLAVVNKAGAKSAYSAPGNFRKAGVPSAPVLVSVA